MKPLDADAAKAIFDDLEALYESDKTTPADRVAAYFEKIIGRPMTRAEKIPLSAIITGDDELD